jgi:iron complex transport system substrate-binding protein
MELRTLALGIVVVMAAVVGSIGAVSPVAASQSCSFPYTATDDTGAEVTVESPPGRIVALGPSAAQTLWEIGAKGQVVGLPVQPYSTYLDGAENRAPVMHEDGFTVNVEQVVGLEPDLVLAPNVIPEDTVVRLREAGLTVYRFEAAGSLEDVYEKTRLTGRLTNRCSGAEATVAWMQERVNVVRQAVDGEDRPRVVYPLGGGFIAPEGSFIDDMLTTAGGENIAARANITTYQQVSPEVIVEQDPEWIVRPSTLPESEIRSAGYNETTAVREDQIVVVDANLASQPAPRIVYPLQTIAAALHPEAYATANETPPATATTASPTESTTEPPSPTESPGQPGFGLAVGLGSLLAALLLRRR